MSRLCLDYVCIPSTISRSILSSFYVFIVDLTVRLAGIYLQVFLSLSFYELIISNLKCGRPRIDL